MAVPTAKICLPPVFVRNIPGATIPEETAVTTRVLGDAAGMVPVTVMVRGVPTAMVAPMSWTPAVLTPGGQK